MTDIAGLEVGLPTSMAEVTPAWMTSVLRTSGEIEDGTSVSTISIDPFMVGVGLLGQLARATMSYEGGSGPATVILKWPTDIPQMRGMADALNAYEREVRFYRELAPTSVLATPKVHAAMIDADKVHSMIVMEDLSGLRQGDRINGLTWEEAVIAVKTGAEFHAQWYESDRLAEFAECWYPLDVPVYNVILPQMFAGGWDNAQIHGAAHLNDELREFGNDWSELLPAMQKHLVTAPCLVHADWRADNMFVTDDGEGIITIDFQLAGVGNGAYDLAYFLACSTEREVRGGREKELVQIYVDTLAENSVERDFEQVWFDYRVAAGFHMIYGVTSFAAWDDFPDSSKEVLLALMRRNFQGIVDVDAIGAVRSLVA